jgi:hypothetical protein
MLLECALGALLVPSDHELMALILKHLRRPSCKLRHISHSTLHDCDTTPYLVLDCAQQTRLLLGSLEALVENSEDLVKGR